MTAKLNPRSARKHLQSFRFADLSDEDLAALVTALSPAATRSTPKSSATSSRNTPTRRRWEEDGDE
jgi:hypothetical protein